MSKIREEKATKEQNSQQKQVLCSSVVGENNLKNEWPKVVKGDGWKHLEYPNYTIKISGGYHEICFGPDEGSFIVDF